MRRRNFIAGLASTTASWPLTAYAQHAVVPVVGLIRDGSADTAARYVAAFRKGLNETGYVEGQNVNVEYHWLEGRYDHLPALLADLVRRQVTVIATPGQVPSLAAKAAVATVPIVFGVGEDPVQLGLVASLARPGGNITGLSTLAGTEIYSKHLELLKEVVPNLGRVAVLSNPTFSTSPLLLNALQTSAPALGLSLQIVEARQPDELEPAVAAAEADCFTRVGVRE